MSFRALVVLMLISLLALSACELDRAPTGDDADDPEAAQSFFPTITGYTMRETDNIQDAVAAAAGGAGVLTGNPVQAGLVERLDTLVDCYRDVGAVEARLYTERLGSLETARVPIAGALVIVNQNRVQDNFLSCLTQSPLDGVFGAQSARPEPCYGVGSFEFSGDTIRFFYGATDSPLCGTFRSHFGQYGAVMDSESQTVSTGGGAATE